eukprot:Phypoly_transcript_17707.p1 GENE.Phypoly_transcript_17707~~Phypoly_transcript_17707.p1  ORF type:complete len:173 (+),score=33.12 Phypoly_transcript_17707:275-793(+)
MSFVIRPATVEDVPTIFKFIMELAVYEKLEHEVVATEEILKKTLFGPKQYAEVLIAELRTENQPAIAVGYALYFYNFSTFLGIPGIYLEDLYIQPAYRGKNYGTQMLVRLADLCKEKGCGRLEWSVLKWNEPSIKFYLSKGAIPMKEWEQYRVTGEALDKLASEQQNFSNKI